MRPHRFSKKKILSFVGVSFEFSYMYASFEMPTELRGLVRAMEGTLLRAETECSYIKVESGGSGGIKENCRLLNIHVLSSSRISELQHLEGAVTGKNPPAEDLLTHATDTLRTPFASEPQVNLTIQCTVKKMVTETYTNVQESRRNQCSAGSHALQEVID